MPRPLRAAVGGIVYHVINCGNARRTIFETPADYELMLSVMSQGHDRVAMRTIGYCLMPITTTKVARSGYSIVIQTT